MDRDTALGGDARRFPSTCWSRFGSTADPAAFETLARLYWKPIYGFIRSQWAKTNEDAKDLTQGFFIWMMESGFVKQADPARGRFRAFIKLALGQFLSKDQRAARTLKRGGELVKFELDRNDAGEGEIDLPDPAGRPPDEVLDDTWKRELLARAEEELERSFRAEGKETYHAIFRDYYFSESGDIDYQKAAEKHGVSRVDVSNFLMAAKRRYQEIITDLVAETVESPEDLDEELRSLFGRRKP